MARDAIIASALLLATCARERARELDACRIAEAQLLREPARAGVAIETCEQAYRKTGSPDALLARVRAQLMSGQLDAVVEAAQDARGFGAARFWHMAGDAELERHRPAEAQRWYERALASHRMRDPRRAANVAGRLADLRAAANAPDEAIRFQQLSRTLAAASGDAELEAMATLGLVGFLLDVGDVRAARGALAAVDVAPTSYFFRTYQLTSGEVDALSGRPAAAAASFERCVADVQPPFDPSTQLRCHLGRAAQLVERHQAGDDAAARAELDRAATYVVRADELFGVDPDRAAEVAWRRAQIDLLGGQRDQALAALRAVPADTLGAAMRSRIAFTLARALVDSGDVAAAELQYGAAAAAVEELRDGAHYRETRRSLPRELRAPYEALFVLRARAGDSLGALQVMERALTRDFIDQLAAGVVGGTAGGDAAQIAAAERRARALRTLDARPAPALRLTAAPAAVIAFFTAEGSLWRVVVRDGVAQIVRVETLASVRPLVEAVRADPADPSSEKLRLLLLPDTILPPPETPLVIVPDPSLEGVRFAALRGSGGYLIERHPLTLAPTIDIALTPPTTSPAAGPAVVLGDPDGSLPEARDEATTVAELLGVQARLGRDADRDAIAVARRASTLHVASHGSTRDDGTLLLLADGAFDGADVLELALAPDLVVVASCSSAATRPDALWTSVAAAFLASGAGHVVGATGSVPDEVARVIAVELHRSARTVGAAPALAQALRAAIARGTPVASWSAFAVLGHQPAS